MDNLLVGVLPPTVASSMVISGAFTAELVCQLFVFFSFLWSLNELDCKKVIGLHQHQLISPENNATSLSYICYM